MFEFTSPRKLGSVNSNMNSGVLEAESVKFSPFSGELHLKSAFGLILNFSYSLLLVDIWLKLHSVHFAEVLLSLGCASASENLIVKCNLCNFISS